MRRARLAATAIVAALTSILIASTLTATPAQAAGGPNLSLGKPTSVSSTNGSFVAGNINDGSQATYWESSGAFPQWAQVDLGTEYQQAQEFGAITPFPSTKDITGVTIRDTDIYDSTYDGIQFKNGGGNMPNVVITNVRIDKSNNGSGILAMSGARGNATLTNVTITNCRDGNILTEPGS